MNHSVDRPRVLLISHAFSPEGPRRQVDALGKLVNLRVVAPPIWRTIPWPTTDREEESGQVVTYRRMSLGGFQYLLLTPTMGIRQFKPDLVHIDYDPWSAIYWQSRIVVALFARGTPVISSAKKNTFRRHRGVIGAIKRRMAIWGISSTSRIEAASEMTARMYEREFAVSPEHISVVTHMGVDTSLFAPSGVKARVSDELVVGYCGQYSKHKGVDVLVKAVYLARQWGTCVRLELLGEGPMRPKLLEEQEMHDWLLVHDPVHPDEVARFMSGLDIYVLPATILPDHEEHDAHAMLQAMASGVPTIGTRSGIIPEILGQGLGKVVQPSNPEEMASAIQDLANDPEKRKALSKAGSARVRDYFSLTAVAERRAAEYSEDLGLN